MHVMDWQAHAQTRLAERLDGRDDDTVTVLLGRLRAACISVSAEVGPPTVGATWTVADDGTVITATQRAIAEWDQALTAAGLQLADHAAVEAEAELMSVSIAGYDDGALTI